MLIDNNTRILEHAHILIVYKTFRTPPSTSGRHRFERGTQVSALFFAQDVENIAK